MLYMASLSHTPDKCPGVAIEIRDRVLRMAASMNDVLQSHDCTFQGGWVSKSAHLTFIVLDAPNAHAADDAMVDLGLAVWNTATLYPVITLDEAVGGLPE
jgi:hypothetical protein